VTDFLAAECEKPICIHEHMLKVYGEVTVDANTLWQWARWIKESQTEGAKFIKTTQWLPLHYGSS
jgi:hypothetical protein